MPPKSKRPCRKPLCPEKTADVSGFCPKHICLAVGWSKPERGTAEQRGYGSHWRKKRATVLERDRHLCRCESCKGQRLPASEVDHILPKKRGGSDDLSNLRAMNSGCHKLKTQKESAAARR